MSQNPNHKETAAALRGHTTAVYQHVVDQGIEEIKRLRNENDQLRLSNERMREALKKLRRRDFPDDEEALWDEIQAALTAESGTEGKG